MAGDLTIGVKLVADSSGVVRGLSLTEAELERLAQRIRRADGDTGRLNNQFNLLHGTLNRLTGALAGVFAVNSIVDFVKSVTDAQIQFQRIEFTLQAVTGSAAAASKEFQFVADVSNKLGLSVTDAASGYARLASSALGAGESLQDLHKGFIGLSEAFTVLHTPAEDVQRILVQLEQGFSLHVLHMRDLIALSNSLPSTFELATEAVKGTGKSLDQWLKEGGIPAKLFFERVTEELHERFGPTAKEAADSLLGQLNRIHNTFFLMKADASKGGFLEGTTQALKDLNDTLNLPSFKAGLDMLLTALAELAAGFAKLISILGLASEKGLGDAIGNALGLKENINNPVYKAILDKRDEINKQIQTRKEQLAYYYPGEHPDLVKQLNAEIADLQNKYNVLSNAMMHVQPIIKLGTVTVHGNKPQAAGVTLDKKFDPEGDFFAAVEKAKADAFLKIQDTHKANQAASDKLLESVMLPVEKLNQQLDQLSKLHSIGPKNGGIDDETFFLATEKAQSAFDKLNKSSKDFVDSLKKSLDPMQALQDAAGQMTSQLVGGLTDAITSGKSFGKVMENIASEIGNMMVKIFIMFAMQKAMQGIAAMGAPSFDFVPLPSAKGNVFDGSGLVAFANGGVVTRPTLFPFANGTGLMGEAGPEAIMPLKRLSGGKLGVHAEGGGGVVVNINNNSQATATASQRRGPDGRHVIDVTVEDSFKRLLNAGRLDSALAANAGTKRPGRF